MKFLSVFLALSLSATPAFAGTWAIQTQGASQCSVRFDGPTAPTPPTGGAVVPFAPVNNDNEVSNYQINSGQLVYAPGGNIWAPVNGATLINGTSGSFYWSELATPQSKELVAAFSGYTQASTTITFPVPFMVKPSIVSSSLTGISVTAATLNSVTFTANNVSGTILIKGI